MVDYPLTAEEELLQEEAYNAGDKQQVNNARKKDARERKEELDYIRHIMSTPAGRKWMMKLLNTCKTFSNPIVPGETHYTYHNLGEQNIGKKYLQDINDGAPDDYVRMMKESKDNKRAK